MYEYTKRGAWGAETARNNYLGTSEMSFVISETNHPLLRPKYGADVDSRFGSSEISGS